MVNRIRKRSHRLRRSQKGQFRWDTKKSVRQRTDKRSRRWNRIIYGISAVLLCLGVFVGMVVFLRTQHLAEEVQEISKEANITVVCEPPAKPEAKSEAVISELLSFVNDRTHTARSKRMHGQADALEYLEDFYNQRGNALPRKIINPAVSAVDFKDREVLLVAFLDENSRSWSAPFEWDGRSYRLHWEAMVGYGDISWHEFFEKRPKGTFKMRANFFLPENEVFDPVATDHIVALMSHPELIRSASVLIQNGSEIQRQLSRYPRTTDIPGIVEIEWPEGEGNQPRLTRWLQRDWID